MTNWTTLKAPLGGSGVAARLELLHHTVHVAMIAFLLDHVFPPKKKEKNVDK